MVSTLIYCVLYFVRCRVCGPYVFSVTVVWRCICLVPSTECKTWMWGDSSPLFRDVKKFLFEEGSKKGHQLLVLYILKQVL